MKNAKNMTRPNATLTLTLAQLECFAQRLLAATPEELDFNSADPIYTSAFNLVQDSLEHDVDNAHDFPPTETDLELLRIMNNYVIRTRHLND